MHMVDHCSNEGTKAHIGPAIKWPGGKRALAPIILKHVPSVYGKYYEPFFGGGAVFFALRPPTAIIADTNEELINVYLHVRDHPKDLVKTLRSLKNSEDNYYAVRSWNPRTPLRRAARTLYLTRLAFNGIHRVNLKGKFNVPYGHKSYLKTVDEEQLLQASEALQGAQIEVGDFELTTQSAQAGDVIYFDPPYTVAHASNGFVKYNERIFSWQDQERLAAHARTLARKGCRVIVSNADHSSLRNLYSDYECHVIERHSVIAASSSHRKQITECIFVLGDCEC